MKIEVNIDKRYFMISLGIMFILAGVLVYAAVDTSQPYHSASQIEFSDGRSLQEYIDSAGAAEFSPGNIVIGASPKQHYHWYSSWTRVKEITVGSGGSVTTSFDLRSSRDGYPVYARVYLNGAAVGTSRSRDDDNWRTYTENIDVSAGDRVQLYVNGGCYNCYGGTKYVYVKDFKISVRDPFPGASVSYEI